MKKDDLLEKVGSLDGVVEASGDYIPSLKPGTPPSLYLNLIFRDKRSDESYASFLSDIRSVTYDVIFYAKRLLQHENYKGISLSFFHILGPGQNLRIYRVSPQKESFEAMLKDETKLHLIEESYQPELKALLLNSDITAKNEDQPTNAYPVKGSATSLKISLLIISVSVALASVFLINLRSVYLEMFSDHNSRLPGITEFVLSRASLFLLTSCLIPALGLLITRRLKRKAANVTLWILTVVLISAGIALVYGVTLPLVHLDTVSATK
jgi:hypothetical protein